VILLKMRMRDKKIHATCLYIFFLRMIRQFFMSYLERIKD
jgi:hypothetical protein